jgi:hypothetical protein
VPGKALPPYHLGEQYADALLRPVADTLAELEARLQQHADRLRLAEADRQRIERARGVVADAREQLRSILGIGSAKN